jgi:hypothetical protein
MNYEPNTIKDVSLNVEVLSYPKLKFEVQLFYFDYNY